MTRKTNKEEGAFADASRLFKYKSLGSIGIRVGSAGLSFLMFLVLARWLSADQFGQFGSMFGLGSFCAIAVLAGQHLLILRQLSSSENTRELPKKRWIFRIGVGSAALLAVLVSLGIATFALSTNSISFGIRQSTLLGAAVFIIPMAAAEMSMNVCRAYGSVYWAQLPRDILWRLIVILSSGVLLLAFGASLTAFHVMLTISGLLTLLVIGQLYGASKRLPFANLIHGERIIDWNNWRLSSKWLWLASLAGNISMHLGVFVASMVLDSSQVGAYFAAQKIAMILALPLNALDIISAPEISRLYHAGDKIELQKFLRRLMLFLLGPILLGLLAILMFGEELLGIFGPEFEFAYPTLLILAFGMTVRSLSGPVGILLLMVGKEKLYVGVFLATEGLAIILLPVLAKMIGINGAAIAATLGMVGVSIVPVIWCRRFLELDPSIGILVKQILKK